MSHLPESLAYWIGGAVLLFWFVGAYNRLVRLRSMALQAYQTLDAALMRQVDFVQVQTAAARARLGEESGESALASLHATTDQLTTLLSTTRQRPLDPARIAALATALHVMLAAWERMHPESVVSFEPDGTLSRPPPGAEGVPLPAAAAVPLTAWPEPSAAAEIARSHFNLCVTRYNAAIRQFPAVLVAWVMQLRPAASLG